MARLLFLLPLAALLVLPPPARAGADWDWPVQGEVITPYQNGEDPYAAGQHRGIDIAAEVGQPVVAATRGAVTFAGTAGSSGLTVAVRTSDGRFDTSYLHLSAISVRRGDAVDQGQRIGAAGTSGRRSAERPHLHFGVREAGSDHAYRDPLGFLPPLTPPAAEPEPPRGAPVPAGSPRTPSPVAAPVPGAGRAPRLAPPQLPGRVPGRRPSPKNGPTLEPYPPDKIAPRPVAFGREPAPASGPRVPGLRDSPPTPTPALRLGPAPHGAAAPGGTGTSAPDASRTAAGGGGGVDLGWLAACVGLVLAAACLGHPDRARAAAGRGRRAAAVLLRPLAGKQ
jgi:murein DD-endopeptidase MepM/ murein hydrolase activator NlpD